MAERHTLNLRRSLFVFETCRQQAIAADCPVIPAPWNKRDSEFHINFVAAVTKQMGPEAIRNVVELHDAWVRDHKQMGWVYGKVHSTANKTHPDMIPFDELPQLEQEKDEVFIGACRMAKLWIRA